MDPIFLSFSHLDSEIAEKFEEWASWYLGASCFRADKKVGLNGGNQLDPLEVNLNYRDAIEQGINSCKVAVVLVTPNSRKSEWVNFEMGLCLGKGVARFAAVLPEHGKAAGKNRWLKVLDDETQFEWPDKQALLYGVLAKSLQAKGHHVPRPFDGKMDIPKSFDFGPKTETELIELLQQSLPLADNPSAKKRFSSREDYDLAPVVFDPFLEEYCEAIRSASHGDPIKLSTGHRLRVAEILIGMARRRVCATSFMSNDRWFQKPDRYSYVNCNCKAGRRLKKKERVTRVFIFDDVSAARSVPDGMRKAMDEMRDNDVDLHWILHSEARDALKTRPLIENLLIVDGRWMTKSTGEGHDGVYVVRNHQNLDSPQGKLIGEYQAAFDDLLNASRPVPRPTPTNLIGTK